MWEACRPVFGDLYIEDKGHQAKLRKGCLGRSSLLNRLKTTAAKDPGPQLDLLGESPSPPHSACHFAA